MSNYIASDTDLTAVANAIRAKSGGSTSLVFPGGFVSEIGSIQTGGADDPEEWMNALPNSDGYIFAALKPLDRQCKIETRPSLSAEYGDINNGVFSPSGTVTDGIVPAHDEVVILRLSTNETSVLYCNFPPCYAVKDNLTTAFKAPAGSPTYSSVTPSYCDYYKSTKNKTGSSAVSYTMRRGAKKVEIKVSNYTFLNNAELFHGSPSEYVELDNVSFQAKLDSSNGIKTIKLRNWTWTGSSTFNDGVVFSNAIEADFSGWSGLSSVTNFNGVFNSWLSLVSLNISGWDMSNATTFNTKFKDLFSLQNFVADGAILPPLPLDFSASVLLTDSSIVNIANALPVASTTITLSATAKSKTQTITGTVSDGTFTADENGTVTLLNFITNTKGWTVA